MFIINATGRLNRRRNMNPAARQPFLMIMVETETKSDNLKEQKGIKFPLIANLDVF